MANRKRGIAATTSGPLLTVVMLTGCATSQPGQGVASNAQAITGADGAPAWMISCNVMSSCMSRAAQVCGGKGFTPIGTERNGIESVLYARCTEPK